MSKRFNDNEVDETQSNKKIKLCDNSSQSSSGENIVRDVKDDSFLPGSSEQSNPLLLNVPGLDDENIEDEIGVNLLTLSDDVLLIILKKLHPFDLLSTSRTCTRLNSLCHDRTLWIDVDFRHESDDKRYIETTIDFNDFIEFLLPNTRSIKKSGCGVDFADFVSDGIKTTQVSITPSFIKNVNQRVRSLKTFALENHIIFGPIVTLECLSPSIEHLSLKNSLVISLPTDKSYFYKIDKILPNLTKLDLSGCEWFRAHSFLALSKSNTLKELHLKGCRGIMDCVPYASLAATFGFPALELLDLRLTHVNDSDISCFNRVENLKKLYLEWAGGENKITDIGVTSFGIEPINANNLLLRNADPLAFVLGQNRSKPLQSSLETLVLKNYRSITDISLKHAAGCLLNLKHLDVRGTHCTRNGVEDFKRRRPDVEILTDFSLNILDENFAFPS